MRPKRFDLSTFFQKLILWPLQFGSRDPKLIVYKSFKGDFSDNPRALFEALQSRGDEFKHVWILRKGVHPELPDNTVVVSPRSLACLRYLGRASYVISNLDLPPGFRKRRGTIYLQTWHGTPLKRIGLDMRDGVVDGRIRRYQRRFQNDTKRWDYLLSQNAFSTPIFRQAFQFNGPILESGYPRNDALFDRTSGEVRSRLRSALGISPSTTAVLYAPTWRDDKRDASGRYTFEPPFDFDYLRSLVGNDYVLLLRLHPNVVTTPIAPGGFVHDVSAEADICHLYLAADVLLTDYSSAMFDFATTGKPILFYVHDMEHYRDVLRGFYFDLVTEAPGPLVTTPEELAECLVSLSSLRQRFAETYAAFTDKYCALEDGGASKRVIDRVFSESKGKGPVSFAS